MSRRPPPAARLNLEPLDDRRLPSSYTTSGTGDTLQPTDPTALQPGLTTVSPEKVTERTLDPGPYVAGVAIGYGYSTTGYRVRVYQDRSPYRGFTASAAGASAAGAIH